MSEQTAIEWTNATVNFWWGCTKVGPGCENCYAERLDKRFGISHFGQGVARRKIAGARKMMLRMDGQSADWAADFHCRLHDGGSVRRVFVQSMSDLFDNEIPIEWFAEAWQTIVQCNRLEIQIVTKRVSMIEKRLAEIGVTEWPQHAGLIITVVTQAEAARDVPRLIELKRRLQIPWVGLSIEPMLSAIDLRAIPWGHSNALHQVDWVICGGESGPKARPMHPDWARSLRDQCEAAGAPFLFKQWGEWAPRRPGPLAQGLDGATDKAACHLWPCGYMAVTGDEYLNRPESTSGIHSTVMWRVGKKAAGRLLDGIEHNGFPRTQP